MRKLFNNKIIFALVFFFAGVLGTIAVGHYYRPANEEYEQESNHGGDDDEIETMEALNPAPQAPVNQIFTETQGFPKKKIWSRANPP